MRPIVNMHSRRLKPVQHQHDLFDNNSARSLHIAIIYTNSILYYIYFKAYSTLHSFHKMWSYTPHSCTLTDHPYEP